MLWGTKESRFLREDPRDRLYNRVTRDYTFVAFCAILVVEFMLCVLFPIADFLVYANSTNDTFHKEAIHYSLGMSALCCAIVTGIVTFMAKRQLQAQYHKDEKNTKRNIYKLGLYASAIMLTLLLILFAATSF